LGNYSDSTLALTGDFAGDEVGFGNFWNLSRHLRQNHLSRAFFLMSNFGSEL